METVENRVALVTGANRGIGKAIVEDLIANGAAKVYAAARTLETLEPLLAQYPGKVVAMQVDLNQPDSIKRAAKSAGDVDIVVNNAGILDSHNPLSEGAIDSLQNQLEVNVYGLMRIAQAFAPVLKANGGGVFVQLNSVASLRTFADFATYCASKAAAYSITQGLREKLAEQGTRVISVHPGPIATDMAIDAGLGEGAEPASVVAESIRTALAEQQFHAFPDTMAKQVGAAYEGFAANVIEANMTVE